MTPRKPFVVYWNNIPAPYMVDRFNALAARGNVELEAWFNERTEPDRSWAVTERDWRFAWRYLPALRLGARRWTVPLPVLGRRPDVLACLYHEPAFMLGWATARLRGARTCFRVLATHDTWVKRSPVKNALKRALFRRVDAIETPGEDGKAFAVANGAAPEKVHFASHTVDLPLFRTVSAALRAEGRDAFRASLGLRGCVFAYAGRLWRGKGLETLLDAFAVVRARAAEPVSLLLIGDGPDEAALRAAALGLRNVVFAGFVQRPELPRYYAAADAFVFPTLGDPYGIAVDEAMACGLPAISSSAAGEISSRIVEGCNGWIVPPGDAEALARRMLLLAGDPALRLVMGENAARRVAGRTPQRWAEDFERIVARLLGPAAIAEAAR